MQKNVRELASTLSMVIDGLMSGSIEPKVAKEIINASGKIIKGHGEELKHDMYHKVSEQIYFFSKPDKPQSLKALDED